MMTEEFEGWFATAQPGDAATYHVGLLARDRVEGRNRAGELIRPAVFGLNDLAKAVLAAALAGGVLLFQRRLGERLYEYVAVRRKEQPGSLNRAA